MPHARLKKKKKTPGRVSKTETKRSTEEDEQKRGEILKERDKKAGLETEHGVVKRASTQAWARGGGIFNMHLVVRAWG